MQNFKFKNPTELIFGQGMIAELPKRLPKGGKILMTCGGGSIRRNGVYDAVRAQLEGYEVVEFWGIEPNPSVQTLSKAIELGKREAVSFVLAVGGGSVIDGSKLIAHAIVSERDPWQLVCRGRDRSVVSLPLGAVLTIPATGSEMNRGAVISNTDTQEKYPFSGDYPLFSILDPTFTYSLPRYQLSCGIADSFVHVIEQYLAGSDESPLMDRWAEGILLTLIEQAPQILAEEHDYDARANFMLCATMALNGFICMGVSQDWATHRIGHELTALTGLTHGHTLVILLPALLRTVGKKAKRDKLLHYASRIWAIDERLDSEERIELAIDRTEEFFRSLGLETKLSELGIAPEICQKIVDRFASRGSLLGEHEDIDHEAIAQIFALCY